MKENDSLFYYHKFRKYVDALNRGSLTLPQNYLCAVVYILRDFLPASLGARCQKFFVDMFF